MLKDIVLIAGISLTLSTFAYAGEEIQLAAAIGAGSSSTVPANGAGTGASGGATAGATTAGGGAGSAAASAATMATASMVTVGVLAAGAIAVVASGGSSSTSQH